MDLSVPEAVAQTLDELDLGVDALSIGGGHPEIMEGQDGVLPGFQGSTPLDQGRVRASQFRSTALEDELGFRLARSVIDVPDLFLDLVEVGHVLVTLADVGQLGLLLLGQVELVLE